MAIGAACTDLTDPILPDGTVEFTPPSYYRIWWEMTTTCSGLSGNLSRVRWYRTAPGVPLTLDGEDVAAYWSSASNRIVLRADVADDGSVVRHEMLHALRRTPGHERPFFLERCGGTVVCESACIAESERPPPPPPLTPHVSVDALELTVELSNASPSLSVDDGYFSIVITARNRASHAVVVSLPRPSGSSPYPTFGFQLKPSNPSLMSPSKMSREFTNDTGILLFAPGETKLHVFDYFPGSLFASGTLQYQISGAFSNRMTSASRLLTLRP